jgi:amino acid adenylation domain-containing protein
MPTTTLKGAHLSIQQDRLWSFQRGSRTYCSWCTILIQGTLNLQVFLQALHQLVEQHTIFQTVFYPLPGMDIPVQVIGHHIEFHCPIICLEAIAEPRQKILLEALLSLSQEKPFDLEHGPLLRTVLFCLSEETSLLLMNLPALCSDSSTLPLLIADLLKRYNACLADEEIVEEPLQYTAVSAWQKQLLQKESEEAKVAHEFWEKFDLSQITHMYRFIERAGIVKNSNPQAIQKKDFEPLILHLEIEETVLTHIHALASSCKVSTMAVLLACWSIVLCRLTDEQQLVIGVACNGRNHEELAEVLGLYTRFVPLSVYLKDDWAFQQVLAFLEPSLDRTMRYQSYFSWPSAPDVDNDPVSPSFFPILFEHESWPASFTGEKLSFSLEQRFCCTEPFILKLSTLQVGEGLQLELHYDPKRIIVEHVSRIASILRVLLQSIVEQSQAPIGILNLLATPEQRCLITTFSAPSRPLPAQSLHRLFEAHAKHAPSQSAVISAKECLTYQQLNERANRLAHVLRKRGIGPNVLVGLCMERGAQMLAGLLGILKAGGAYLPLDAGSPAARLSYQLQESQATLLLTQQAANTHLSGWEERTLWLEELEQEMSQVVASDLPETSEADDLAYIIYTSGSTGTPKGVMIQQGSVVNYVLAVCEQLGAEPGWQYATVSTLAADLGNTAIFCALASGGCVQVLDYETVTSAEAMARWVEQHPIDVLKIVPSHLSALLAEEHSKKLLPHRALILGGEVLPTSLLEQIEELGSHCEVYNHYGPTETTIGVLVNPLGVLGARESEKAGVTVPLGSPIANTEVYVLDQRMQVVPVGITGELYVGGAGLAMGYVQQGGQTAAQFVPHPYSKRAGARLYRTGDLARYSEEGKIEFVSRRDSQVKLRGYRIELAEIEVLLRQHPNVHDSAVVLHENLPGVPHLIGFIVPQKLPVPTKKDLQDFLRQYLPEYMVPPTFVYLKFLPLTANGKVDRHQLITPERDKNNRLSFLIDLTSESRIIMQPRDTFEMQLLQIWEDILERQPISIFDDFFNLGGHSLLAVRLISRLSRQFKQNLDLATLFQHPTIAQLAVVLRQQTTSEETIPLVAIQPQGSRPPFFCVHPAGGTAFCYINLARCLGPDQPFYGLQTPDQSHTGKALGTVEEMATHYLVALQRVQPRGPYLLGGWSAGGIIAFEIAQQLQRQGNEVGVLAIIDSSMPNSQMRAKAIEEEIDLGDAGVIKELLHHFKITVPDDFYQCELDEQLHYVTEQAKKANAIPIDTSLELVRRYTHIMMLNKHITHYYAPQSYPNKIDYFASCDSMEQTTVLSEREDKVGTARQQDRLQSWCELAKGGLEVHLIPGNHLDIVEEPNVQVLAKVLRGCIDQVM